MASWKKITLWIAGAIIVMTGSCTALLSHLIGDAFEDMCATTVIDQFSSPSGARKAVLFQIDCGATASFNTHVSIVPGSLDTGKKDSIPQSFFVADSNRGQAPAGKGGGPEVKLLWKTNEHLEVEHHSLARVIRAETKSSGVVVEYKTFR